MTGRTDGLPLAGVRVIETGTGIGAGYAGKLFRDAGAEVVKVEPIGGDPLRRRVPDPSVEVDGDGPLFRFLAAGKRSVIGDPGDGGRVDALIAGADLVIQDGASSRAIDPVAHPATVVFSLSPYGSTGPWRDRPGTDATIQSEGGSTHNRGAMGEQPFVAGGELIEFSAAAYGSVGALAALMARRRHGRGDHVDCSLLETCVVVATSHMSLARDVYGRPPGRGPRYLDRPGVERTSDGWVGMTTLSAQQVRSFCEMIGRPDLAARDELSFLPTRIVDEAFLTAADDWFATHTTAEALDAAEAHRVPAAPIGNGETVTGFEQFVARGSYGDDGAGMTVPRRPWRIDGVGEVPVSPAPAPGADERVELGVASGLAERAGMDDDPHRLPLDGVRILDVTSWWAGPSASHLLASLGADVVHVEGADRPDPIRVAAAAMFAGQPGWLERSNIHQAINSNKRAIAIDLATDTGRDVLRRLVPGCDVVMENYTPRVLDDWGLDGDAVRALEPTALFVRMPAFGLDGPWRDRGGFAQTIEQVSGMAWVTGIDAPDLPRGVCDPMAGAHAAFATLLGLVARDDDPAGAGRIVEVSMVEAGLNVTAEQVGWTSLTGRLMQWNGNRGHGAVVQGLYRAAGEDEWLSVSVAEADAWDRLVAVLGHPAVLDGVGLTDALTDPAQRDAVDKELADWAAARDPRSAADELCAAGVAAGATVNAWALHEHPQLVARGFFEQVEHPVVGPLDLPGQPFTLRGASPWNRRLAPRFGEHTDEVLTEAGLGPDEIDDLLSRGVIAGPEPLA